MAFTPTQLELGNLIMDIVWSPCINFEPRLATVEIVSISQ